MAAMLGRVLAVSLMLVAAAAHAVEPPTAGQTPIDKPADAPAPARDKHKPAAPASTFTPSEKIGADSAVSFPVDI